MYDTSTANPINPQGTVGGGNVFYSAPIFGYSEISGGGSFGNNPATTTNKDTAALGGGAASTDVPAKADTGTTFTAFLAANKTVLIIGSACLVGLLVLLRVLKGK